MAKAKDEEFYEDDGLEESHEPRIQTVSPSGADIFLLTEEEKTYYDDVSKRYQADNKFTNISDLQELDRIMTLEVMCYRWSRWLLEDKDYWGTPCDVVGIQRNIESYSKEIRALKRDLGIDKNTRDKEHGDSPAEYIANLRLRAKEFGVMRNEQAVAAITKLKEIQSKVTLYQNYDELERNEFHWHAEDVIKWIDEECDKFDQIDANFRATSQKLWVRTL
jgi:hypothetical protein